MVRFHNRNKFGSSRDGGDDMNEPLKCSFLEHVQNPHAATQRKLARIESQRSRTSPSSSIHKQQQYQKGRKISQHGQQSSRAPRINKVLKDDQNPYSPSFANDCLSIVDGTHLSNTQYAHQSDANYTSSMHHPSRTRNPLSEISKNTNICSIDPMDHHRLVSQNAVNAPLSSRDPQLKYAKYHTRKDFPGGDYPREIQTTHREELYTIDVTRHFASNAYDKIDNVPQYNPLLRLENHVLLSVPSSYGIRANDENKKPNSQLLIDENSNQTFSSHPIKFVSPDLCLESSAESTLSHALSPTRTTNSIEYGKDFIQHRSIPPSSILSKSEDYLIHEKRFNANKDTQSQIWKSSKDRDYVGSNQDPGITPVLASPDKSKVSNPESPASTLSYTYSVDTLETGRLEDVDTLETGRLEDVNTGFIIHSFEDNGSIASTISHAISLSEVDERNAHNFHGAGVAASLLPELRSVGSQASGLSYGYLIEEDKDLSVDHRVGPATRRDIPKTTNTETASNVCDQALTSRSPKKGSRQVLRMASPPVHRIENAASPTSTLSFTYSSDDRTSTKENSIFSRSQINLASLSVWSGSDEDRLRNAIR